MPTTLAEKKTPITKKKKTGIDVLPPLPPTNANAARSYRGPFRKNVLLASSRPASPPRRRSRKSFPLTLANITTGKTKHTHGKSFIFI